MKILKTANETLSDKEIIKYIADYEINEVPTLDKLWDYYIGNNVKILTKKVTDPNNPDNRIPIPYGRKIVNTYVGYAWRPRFTTIKANVEKDQSLEVNENASDETKELSLSKEEKYVNQLKETYNLNNEHIKTSRDGRNMGIFGVAYELLYTDGELDTDTMTTKSDVKFFCCDPREIILIYDYSPEPKKKIGIHYTKVSSNYFKVEVYYKLKVGGIVTFDMKRSEINNEWELSDKKELVNFFEDVPIVPFYFGDDMLGIIKPVLGLIDANDTLFSDSMNEFDRFAFAYLIMKKYGLTDPTKVKTPGVISTTLQSLKKKRMFENVPADADIKFLTKDIPTAFIDFMAKQIHDQIHVQSHIPDFNMMTGALTGAAIDRLLFDFENMVSSAEADFDLGLLERIRLINIIYKIKGIEVGTNDDFTIEHKRNKPMNTKEFADTALVMKNAGFSSYVIADGMPDDIIPDVQAELARQKKEAGALMPDIENIDYSNMDEEPNPEENV